MLASASFGLILPNTAHPMVQQLQQTPQIQQLKLYDGLNQDIFPTVSQSSHLI